MEVDTKWLDSLQSVETHYIKENQAKKQSQPRIKNLFARNNNGHTQDQNTNINWYIILLVDNNNLTFDPNPNQKE